MTLKELKSDYLEKRLEMLAAQEAFKSATRRCNEACDRYTEALVIQQDKAITAQEENN